MRSKALSHWRTTSKAQLDEFERAHAKLNTSRRSDGRAIYATEQLEQAYLIAVASQFQRFCRTLHAETAEFLVERIAQPDLQLAVRRLFIENRKLDTGNAHDGTIGPDFNRFGLSFLTEVDGLDARNRTKRRKLNQLNTWRNAVVHQEFTFNGEQKQLIADTKPRLRDVRTWRKNCDVLAKAFERVTGDWVARVVGKRPW